jgi:hypothetical protein
MNQLYISGFSNIKTILRKKQQNLMTTPFACSTTDSELLESVSPKAITFYWTLYTQQQGFQT